MTMTRRALRCRRAISLVGFVATTTLQPAFAVAQNTLPARLSDSEFWALVTDISEPGGYFRITDNFTSNEPEVGRLYGMLRQRETNGGVYVGVGPEQNFTYIAAIRPQMAFVIDIRRQAVVQHLMYKAIFELSADRADFISLLFSKPRPDGLGAETKIEHVWDAYGRMPSDSALAMRNLERITRHLTATHRFTLTPEESDQLRAVYWAFYYWGPSISTRGAPGGGRGGGNGSTFADLTGFSPDDAGIARSFLATEADFATVKSLHERNLIVPVSGDFGGPKALRAIGAYVKGKGAVVRAFYVSNVEQYLFMDGKQGVFYDNAATLPVDAASVFIRPYSLRRFAVTESLCPIGPFLASAKDGRVMSNNEALACAR